MVTKCIIVGLGNPTCRIGQLNHIAMRIEQVVDFVYRSPCVAFSHPKWIKDTTDGE
ncbi:hypothetical protein EDD70_2372 [Hydrogenoanaerobacterium saccharovorans]|uniref:Uncharacterized protein n=1 Tax=Hydrogenoanaerobacterium saccharovorans TaxID=474960 RepID=A0A1H8CZR2_9FIRM|nr:hypothetical protein [Hydrogenoanaerobacterium saccharovorans]RPF43408.1 hypothetical protein EDD70_2372 [Hydrogenoanaerobacterium saccharovorans]SEN00540.1 hypothetical protein SAMN05216180_2431 [Hydrogenoanaerobacterium saccharovorans]